MNSSLSCACVYRIQCTHFFAHALNTYNTNSNEKSTEALLLFALTVDAEGAATSVSTGHSGRGCIMEAKPAS